jgi:hypothetical protein
MEAQAVCRFHGGAAPQAKAKARARIEEAADRMAARLLKLAESDDVPAYVALAATDSALDRAGLAAPKQVEVGLSEPWQEVLGAVTGIARITREESRQLRGIEPPEPLEVVDAEVVEDGPSGPANAQNRPAWGQEPPNRPGTGLQTMEDALDDLAEIRRNHARQNRRPGL